MARKEVFKSIREFCRNIKVILAAILLISIGVFALGFYLNVTRDESNLIVILFSMPLLAHIYGLVYYLSYLHQKHEDNDIKSFLNLYLGVTAWCIFSYCLLWTIYRPEIKASNHLYSIISLVFILTLLLPVGLITQAILSYRFGQRRDRLRRLHSGVSKVPFMSLLLFFTVFIGIAYLFGFAFAFHDKSMSAEYSGLFMPKIYSCVEVERNEKKKGTSD